MPPKVCIGMMLYNDNPYLRSALDSLLSQTYRNFKLVISDDCSLDNPTGIINEYSDADSRIEYFRHTKRIGMVDNYRYTFNSAGDNVVYFAWAAGHDLYDQNWLESLVQTLESNQEAALAYSATKCIDENNILLRINNTGANAENITEPKDIWRLCIYGKHFGDRIYGLFRKEALTKAGVFRKVIFPDRLLIFETALNKKHIYIADALWSRRFISYRKSQTVIDCQDTDVSKSVVDSHVGYQRKALFVKPPWYVYFPPLITHMTAVFWNDVTLSSRHSGKRRTGLLLMLALVFREIRYLWIGLSRRVRLKEWLINIGWLKKLYDMMVSARR